MKNAKWAEVIRFYRIRHKLTSRKLAALIGVDPSYITLMERNGCVPRRDKVMALAQVLKIKTDVLLIIAGYAPEQANLILALREYDLECATDKLIPELVSLLMDIVRLSKSKQRSLVLFLDPLIETIRRQPTKRRVTKRS